MPSDRKHARIESRETIEAYLCQKLLFNVATALVFYKLDAEAGLRQHEELAKQGHVDSMVACGVILMDGLGIPAQEEKAIEWLKKAVALGSTQGCYELAVVLYTGLEGVLEEDAEAAFVLFKKAAEQDHTAALFMTADCLVLGEGSSTSSSSDEDKQIDRTRTKPIQETEEQ